MLVLLVNHAPGLQEKPEKAAFVHFCSHFPHRDVPEPERVKRRLQPLEGRDYSPKSDRNWTGGSDPGGSECDPD